MRLSLDKVIAFWGRATPNNVALQNEELAITYSELSTMVNKACSYTFSEDEYGLIINNNVDYVTIMLCLMRKKIKFINIGHIVSENQLNEFLKINSIKTIITDDTKLINRLPYVLSTHDIIQTEIETSTFPEQNLVDNVGGFLSSGTTGIPKIYFRDQYSLISEALLWIMELNLNRTTSFYVSKPFTYIGSFVLLYAVLYSGGGAVFPSKYTDRLYVPDYNIDFAFIVPADIRQLMQKKHNMYIKNVITMGSPISSEEKQLFSKMYGCNIYEMWGNSEGLATITNIYESPNCNSVGRATFTDEIFIIDEKGQKLPPNSLGIIAGVTDNGTISDDSTDFIASEDIGYLDSNNELHLIGRKKNIVLFKDNNYFCTTDLEKNIKKRFPLEECVAILVDKVFYIFLVKSSRNTEKEIVEYIKEKYSIYFDEISFGKIILIDEIPYNSNGKIDYTALNSII